MFSIDLLEMAGIVAVTISPVSALLLMVGRWGFHQLLRRQNDILAQLIKLNGTVASHEAAILRLQAYLEGQGGLRMGSLQEQHKHEEG